MRGKKDDMKPLTRYWPIVAAALILTIGCQRQEAGEVAEEAAADPAMTAEDEAPGKADEAAPTGEEIDAVETPSEEAAAEGGEMASTGDGADEEMAPQDRQVMGVEFVDPYTEEDLAWLAEQGMHLMSKLNDRAVTVWFGSEFERDWASDPRIKDVQAMMK